MRLLRALPALLCAAAFAATAASAPATHPFTVHDMLAMDRISDPAVSPDGRRIAFVVSSTDLEANRRRTDVWVVDADGGRPHPLTTDPASDESPRWSPDGAGVLFLSSRGGSTQVWRIAIDGGEARRVTDLPLDVEAFAPSPDGRRLVVALRVFPDADIAVTRKRLDEIAEREKHGPTGRIYDRLFVRHWDAWADGRRNHLFAVPVAGGTPVDLMKGMDADCPAWPDGDAGDFTVSHDGRQVVFSAKNVGREEAWSTNYDLFAVAIDGSARPRDLTPGNPAWDAGPLFSPDGRTLAWRAMKVAGYEADRFRIVLRGWPDGPARVLTEAWDRSPDQLAWAPDGRALYAVAENLGNTALFAIDIATGHARAIVTEGTVHSPAPAGARVIYGLDHMRSPVELYSVRPDGGDVRPLTRLNADKVAAARMGRPEQFRFVGAGGDTVFGYVVTPADFDRNRHYPVAYLIHGGPQGSFGNDFHYRWNPQAYAGAGYAVVMVDFHGSTGYGQAFCDAIRGDWGGKPLEDLQKGLAAALARYPWMDGSRVAALGASYGGYMINWIAGQWPDRFRCLVCHDGNLDERAAYFDTEELWFPEHDHRGTPWTAPEEYEKHNPLRFVDRWKTPTLVIHSARDFRVPESQGLMTFNALQRRGVPSRLLRFPDESHWVLKPRNSILWHETVLEWLDRWTKK